MTTSFNASGVASPLAYGGEFCAFFNFEVALQDSLDCSAGVFGLNFGQEIRGLPCSRLRIGGSGFGQIDAGSQDGAVAADGYDEVGFHFFERNHFALALHFALKRIFQVNLHAPLRQVLGKFLRKR